MNNSLVVKKIFLTDCEKMLLSKNVEWGKINLDAVKK